MRSRIRSIEIWIIMKWLECCWITFGCCGPVVMNLPATKGNMNSRLVDTRDRQRSASTGLSDELERDLLRMSRLLSNESRFRIVYVRKSESLPVDVPSVNHGRLKMCCYAKPGLLI